MTKEIIACTDKVIGKILTDLESKSKGGIIIPDVAKSLPQCYIEVTSVGPLVKSNIKQGDIIVCHVRGGQDMLINNQIFKVLVEQEIYGVLKNE